MVLIEFDCGFQDLVNNDDVFFNKKLRCPECREIEEYEIVETS